MEGVKAMRGAMEGMKAMIVAYPYGVTLLGGTLLAALGGVIYEVRSYYDLRKELALARKDVEEARMEARFQVQAARTEVQAAKTEMAEKFLTYGFAEEYANYQKIMKLKEAESRDEEKK